MIRRLLSARRRITPLLLCARTWRPRLPALSPLSPAELWLLAVALQAGAEQVHHSVVGTAARAAGGPLSVRDIIDAARMLRRRGLCREHGNKHDRVSLTAAGRLVARLEAADLPVAPKPARPAPGPAVEVWRCARRPVPTTVTHVQEMHP
jgi:hypothetical protein